MKVIGVEFEGVGKILYYSNPKNFILKKGDKIVAETSRGKELGVVVIEEADKTNFEEDVKPLLAIASNLDIAKYEENKKKAKQEYQEIQNMIYSCGIDNKLCKVEYVLDASKMIVSFVAEERVDFRELVKKLTQKYRVKVEIKLIGARDEFKVKGALGPCGRECCCASHLRNFEKITIKMAKNQNLSLSPGKISGACGKLMCCLEYENETYTELSQTMPKINSIVKTPNGDGLVVYNDLFNQKCTVKIEVGENKFETCEFEVKDIEFTK